MMLKQCLYCVDQECLYIYKRTSISQTKEGAWTKWCETKRGKEIYRRLWKMGNTGCHERDDTGGKQSKISVAKAEVQVKRRKENY